MVLKKPVRSRNLCPDLRPYGRGDPRIGPIRLCAGGLRTRSPFRPIHEGVDDRLLRHRDRSRGSCEAEQPIPGDGAAGFRGRGRADLAHQNREGCTECRHFCQISSTGGTGGQSPCTGNPLLPRGLSAYIRWSNENTLVVVQVEGVEGVDHIDEILEVKSLERFEEGAYVRKNGTKK